MLRDGGCRGILQICKMSSAVLSTVPPQEGLQRYITSFGLSLKKTKDILSNNDKANTPPHGGAKLPIFDHASKKRHYCSISTKLVGYLLERKSYRTFN